MALEKVKVIKDDSGHWYVIPESFLEAFGKEDEDEDFIDTGKFDEKYGKYRTGGDLNNIQLYAEIEK